MEVKTIKIMTWLRQITLRGYNLGDLAPLVITFALIAIIGAVSLLILNNFQGQSGTTCASTLSGNFINSVGICTNANTMITGVTVTTPAYNGLAFGVSGINQIMTFLPLLALVVVAAVIIGVVVGAFVLGGHKSDGF